MNNYKTKDSNICSYCCGSGTIMGYYTGTSIKCYWCDGTGLAIRSQSHTEPISEPTADEVDNDEAGISSTVQSLLEQMLTTLNNIDKRLAHLEIKADRAPVVVSVPADKPFNETLLRQVAQKVMQYHNGRAKRIEEGRNYGI